MTTPDITRLGIIAGNGRMPVECADGARKAGVEFIAAVCFNGETGADVAGRVDEALWTEVGKLGKLIAFFQKHGIRNAVMAGQINPRHTVSSLLKLDLRMTSLLLKLPNRKADTVLGGIARELEGEGIVLLDSTRFIPHLMAPAGAMGQHTPTARESEDVAFGAGIAREIGRVDIGQTVVVKHKSVVAVEAMEGSDAAIERGCRLAGRGAVIVKVSKPGQDMRFDVPVIGPRTLQTLVQGGGRVLAVEAGKTIVLDRDELVKEADRTKVCLIGF